MKDVRFESYAGDLKDKEESMDPVTDYLAMAPDDEVLAELLALQSELINQVRQP